MKTIHQDSEKFPLSLSDMGKLTENVRQNIVELKWPDDSLPISANIIIKEKFQTDSGEFRFFEIKCDINFNNIGNEKLYSKMTWEIIKEIEAEEFFSQNF